MVETWLQFWLDNFGKMTMCPSTYESYSGNLRIHIKPHIGDFKLTKLEPPTCRNSTASC